MAYVYLIVEEPITEENTKEWVKIGYTQNPPEWRMDANLSRGNPRTIRLAAVFEYESNDEAWNEEQEGHKEFKRNLHQKEWFQINWKKVEQWYLQRGAKLRVASKQ